MSRHRSPFEADFEAEALPMPDPVATTEACFDAIARENPLLNACVRVTADLARAQAADAAAASAAVTAVAAGLWDAAPLCRALRHG